jgi:hypothetical protein
MMRDPKSPIKRYLGIEGGGTRTVALLADGSGQILRRLETGPANMKLLTEAQLTRHFRSIAAALPLPDALGIGLSGAWTEADFRKIRSVRDGLYESLLPGSLETALTAAADGRVRRIRRFGCGRHRLRLLRKSTKGSDSRLAGRHVLGDKAAVTTSVCAPTKQSLTV